MLHHHWYTWVIAAFVSYAWTCVFDSFKSAREIKDWDGEK